MIFREPCGLRLPDICLTGDEKPRKNLTQEICPDRRSNPSPLRDRRACHRLFHKGGHFTAYIKQRGTDAKFKLEYPVFIIWNSEFINQKDTCKFDWKNKGMFCCERVLYCFVVSLFLRVSIVPRRGRCDFISFHYVFNCFFFYFLKRLVHEFPLTMVNKTSMWTNQRLMI